MASAYSPYNPVRMKVAKPVVVPHGIGHQTPAIKHAHTLALSGLSTGTAKKRRKKKAVAASSAKKRKAHTSRARSASGSTRRSASGKAHLVKGSAAAKKRMAALRKMRGKGKSKSG